MDKLGAKVARLRAETDVTGLEAATRCPNRKPRLEFSMA